MSRNLINGLLFQGVWFACVLGGAAASSLWGGLALAVLLAHSLTPWAPAARRGWSQPARAQWTQLPARAMESAPSSRPNPVRLDGGDASTRPPAGELGAPAIRRARSDLFLITFAGVVGFLLDTLWIRLDVLDYAGATTAPAWIVMLWIAVGATLNHSLSIFHARPWLGGLLAGACAPLSYLAGESLGAVDVVSGPGLAAVAVVWAALFVLAFAVAGGRVHIPLRRYHERAH